MGDRELENLLLDFSEASGIQAFMLQFQWGWPIAEILHFTGLCLLFGGIGLFDLRVLGWGGGCRWHPCTSWCPSGLPASCLMC